MPDDRFLHRRQGYSAKLALLDHLAYRVWTQYVLCADDFGVMLESAAVIRGANIRLAQESEQDISAALDMIRSVGLTEDFDHQGQRFVCSLEWQDFQKIRLPRKTYLPLPPAEVLLKCSRKTIALFKKHSPGSSRVDHRLTANGKRQKATGKRQEASEGDAGEATAVADRFEEFYALYPASPNNPGPVHARNTWRKLKPDAELQATIVDAICRQREWPGMAREGGRYVPTPQKWLAEQRWLAPDPPHEPVIGTGKTAGNLAAREAFLRTVAHEAH